MTTAFSASFKQQVVEKAIRRGRGVTLGTLALTPELTPALTPVLRPSEMR